MKNIRYLLYGWFYLLIFQSCTSILEYPESKKVAQVDLLHGIEVEDPYRWLEDDKDEKVKQWIESQNQLTFSYLDKVPYREALRNRLEKLWNYEKFFAI